MKQGVFYLQYVCHDDILSEFIDEGVKTVTIQLKSEFKDSALIEGRGIFEKLLESVPQDLDTEEGKESLKDDVYSDWGHKDPVVVHNDKSWPLY